MIEVLNTIQRSDTKIVDMNDNASTSVLLRCCDPRASLDREEEFLSFWTEVQNSLNELTIHPNGSVAQNKNANSNL